MLNTMNRVSVDLNVPIHKVSATIVDNLNKNKSAFCDDLTLWDVSELTRYFSSFNFQLYFTIDLMSDLMLTLRNQQFIFHVYSYSLVVRAAIFEPFVKTGESYIKVYSPVISANCACALGSHTGLMSRSLDSYIH